MQAAERDAEAALRTLSAAAVAELSQTDSGEEVCESGLSTESGTMNDLLVAVEAAMQTDSSDPAGLARGGAEGAGGEPHDSDVDTYLDRLNRQLQSPRRGRKRRAEVVKQSPVKRRKTERRAEESVVDEGPSVMGGFVERLRRFVAASSKNHHPLALEGVTSQKDCDWFTEETVSDDEFEEFTACRKTVMSII